MDDATPTPDDGGADPWAHVYGQWRLPLLRYVHRLTGDRHQAEDVAHEAFYRLMRAPGPVRAPGAWLFQVATNLVRDGARRSATADSYGASPYVANDVPPGPEPPDRAPERAEAARAVREALARLAPRDRQVLLMREGGCPYPEIAEVLGIQTASVPSVVMRALRRFRTIYEAIDEGNPRGGAT